jgi:hypothetical protein
MSLVFPRPFPLAEIFVNCTMTPVRRQAMGVAENGDDIGIDRGTPTWQGEWETRTLDRASFQIWESWLSSLRGVSRYFLGYHALKEYPVAYMSGGLALPTLRAGGGAFDWTAPVSAIANGTSPNDTLSLATLPSALQLNPGDHVSLKLASSGQVSLHQIIGAGTITADGSGNATFQVEPEIPGFQTTSSVATLYRACGKFRLVKVTPMKATADGGPRPGAATFQGLSTYR